MMYSVMTAGVQHLTLSDRKGSGSNWNGFPLDVREDGLLRDTKGKKNSSVRAEKLECATPAAPFKQVDEPRLLANAAD